MAGAFEDYAKFCFDDAFSAIAAELAGLPYESKIPYSEVVFLQYEVLEDWVYSHTDQDIKHGKYQFKKGQIIELRKDEDPMYFMPDRSKLKLLGETIKSYGNPKLKRTE